MSAHEADRALWASAPNQFGYRHIVGHLNIGGTYDEKS